MADPIKKDNSIDDPFDSRNFNYLFDELYTPLCQFCMRLVNDADIAEDIVQEQFVYLWENWQRLATIFSIKAYLFKAVKNKSLNYLKKQFSKKSIIPLQESVEIPQDRMQPSDSNLLENEELEKLLEKAIESLPLRCRTIFNMKRFAEMSNKEIAVCLNISIKTVEAQMTIAIRKLIAFMSINWCLFVFLLIDTTLKIA
jgi:RNA polymerase sigma-70 factor, ECF subfamily